MFQKNNYQDNKNINININKNKYTRELRGDLHQYCVKHIIFVFCVGLGHLSAMKNQYNMRLCYQPPENEIFLLKEK